MEGKGGSSASKGRGGAHSSAGRCGPAPGWPRACGGGAHWQRPARRPRVPGKFLEMDQRRFHEHARRWPHTAPPPLLSPPLPACPGCPPGGLPSPPLPLFPPRPWQHGRGRAGHSYFYLLSFFFPPPLVADIGRVMRTQYDSRNPSLPGTD